MQNLSQNLTQDIEKYILEMLNSEDDDFIKLRRKELAETFGCVPSQINYVLRSRFTPENGFLVESRRGGNGFIRIVKISCGSVEEKLNHIDDLIGDYISERDARKILKAFQERDLITMRERLLMEIAIRHSEELGRDIFELPSNKRGIIIAETLKRMLHGLMLV